MSNSVHAVSQRVATQDLSPFNLGIPQEVIGKIFNLLECKDLLVNQRVCCYWRQIVVKVSESREIEIAHQLGISVLSKSGKFSPVYSLTIYTVIENANTQEDSEAGTHAKAALKNVVSYLVQNEAVEDALKVAGATKHQHWVLKNVLELLVETDFGLAVKLIEEMKKTDEQIKEKKRMTSPVIIDVLESLVYTGKMAPAEDLFNAFFLSKITTHEQKSTHLNLLAQMFNSTAIQQLINQIQINTNYMF